MLKTVVLLLGHLSEQGWRCEVLRVMTGWPSVPLAIGEVVATSAVRHQGFVPSEAMEAAWQAMASSFGAGARELASEILPYGREMALSRSELWRPSLDEQLVVGELGAAVAGSGS
eukprot:5600112-Amphidinium_carterae.1